MTVRDLYRYKGENGAIDTFVILPMEYEKMFRLEADTGMLLTDGTTTAKVIDIPVDDIDKWYEVEISEEIIEEEPEATTEDYLAALNELGVNTDEES